MDIKLNMDYEFKGTTNNNRFDVIFNIINDNSGNNNIYDR